MSSINRSGSSNGVWEAWLEQISQKRLICMVPTDFARTKVNLAKLGKELDMHLYAEVHASYLLTDLGTREMQLKYERGDFGVCPRVFCEGQHMLPVGPSDEPGQSAVQLYCPRCRQLYKPPSHYSELYGAMFGTGYPNVFFMQLPQLRPLPPTKSYRPSIFGFKVHKSALGPVELSEAKPPPQPRICSIMEAATRSRTMTIKYSPAGAAARRFKRCTRNK